MKNVIAASRLRRALLLLFCVFWVGTSGAIGCSNDTESTPRQRAGQTALRVTFEFGSDLQVDQLSLALVPQGQPGSGVRRTVPEEPRLLESGMDVAFVVPLDWHEDVVSIEVAALSQGRQVGAGRGAATILANQVVELTIDVDSLGAELEELRTDGG